MNEYTPQYGCLVIMIWAKFTVLVLLKSSLEIDVCRQANDSIKGYDVTVTHNKNSKSSI